MSIAVESAKRGGERLEELAAAIPHGGGREDHHEVVARDRHEQRMRPRHGLVDEARVGRELIGDAVHLRHERRRFAARARRGVGCADALEIAHGGVAVRS
jgi:hypothetical protein